MKNQNKLALYIFIALVVLCVVYAFYRSSDLKRNGVILQGQILKSAFSAKSSVMLFKYRFVYNNKTYEDYSPAGVTNSTEFVGKIFPVRFSSKTGRSEILITPRHFKRYNIPHPDSLEWIKRYLIEDFN